MVYCEMNDISIRDLVEGIGVIYADKTKGKDNARVRD
jgi:hypothetical protein